MIKSPDLRDIQAAELRVVAAKQHTIDGARRVWTAVKSSLVRPASLAAVAAAGFCGGLLLSRRRTVPESSSDVERPVARESFTSVVLAFALRSAVRMLPGIASRMWTEHREAETRKAAHAGPRERAAAANP